jgi:diamine N-acetyltransferase
MIKEISQKSDLAESVQIIQDAFTTVREDLDLTKENCPTHPSFMTLEKLIELTEKEVHFFGLYEPDRQIGFAAIEKASDTVYYLEKLSVLPEFRHHGYGKQLMDFVFDYVKKCNGKKISIAVVNEQKILKDWYIQYGFKKTGTKTFEHLPFTVCFLEKNC